MLHQRITDAATIADHWTELESVSDKCSVIKVNGTRRSTERALVPWMQDDELGTAGTSLQI